MSRSSKKEDAQMAAAHAQIVRDMTKKRGLKMTFPRFTVGFLLGFFMGMVLMLAMIIHLGLEQMGMDWMDVVGPMIGSDSPEAAANWHQTPP